jgi:hypothetical protein
VSYRFLLSLDFDSHTRLLSTWPDVGVFGVLYVFVNAEETAACALWQYT